MLYLQTYKCLRTEAYFMCGIRAACSLLLSEIQHMSSQHTVDLRGELVLWASFPPSASPCLSSVLTSRLNWILDRSGRFLMRKTQIMWFRARVCCLFLVSIALVRLWFWVFCVPSYYWLVFILLLRSGPSINSMQNWRTRNKLSRKCIPNSGAYGTEELASL